MSDHASLYREHCVPAEVIAHAVRLYRRFARRLRAKEGGNRDVTVHIFPNLNHLFAYDPVGFPMGYAKLERRRVEPEVIGMAVDWLAERLK